MTLFQGIVLGIVLLTYAGVALGEIPGLRMNRTTIALVGAALLIVVRAASEEQALASLDAATLLLLAAMMIINVNLQVSGFFELVAGVVLRVARSPRILLALIIFTSGLLSAVFLNDPICLMFTPLVIQITRRLGRNPIPYAIGLATAANVGSAATITGNPQNLVIGHTSGIPYLTFTAALGLPALVGLLICWGVIVVVYHREFHDGFEPIAIPPAQVDRPLLARTLVVVVGLMIAFLVGLPIVSSACVAAGILLVSRLKAERMLAIDWPLLAFFGGMFVVTGAIEASGLSQVIFSGAAPLLRGGVPAFSVATAALSNVISNVPAVLLLRSQIAGMPNPQQSWLALAMSSTLAGNLTLLGSAATLIVAERCDANGIKLKFVEYLKCGIPITVLTLAVGIVWLVVF